MLEAALVILDANVITLNPKQPSTEAIAIHEGKIIATGSDKEIRSYIGKKTCIINARNMAVLPGLTDCHVHMAAFGLGLQALELRNVKSIKELQSKLREYAAANPNKKWILGGHWDQEKFSEKRYPTRWDLDAIAPDKPVFLTRVCGHIGIVNSKAMHVAGITKGTTVKGGEVDLDEESGEPSGILRENTLELVRKALPKRTPEELEEACKLACQKAVEAGLTCVHWLLASADEVRVVQNLFSKAKLPLRVHLGVPVQFLEDLIDLGLQSGFGNDMIRIGFVKILADGSLGGHTAALKEPYSDRPETSGKMLYTQKELNHLVSRAHDSGLQLAVHAIGDQAVEAVLKAFRKVQRKNLAETRRHRIEHCSLLNPKLIRQMKQSDLVASVQPHFVVSDFWIADRLGKARARWAYPFKTLMHEGPIVASGSDCPVEPISPILGIWAASTRTAPSHETLSVEEALETYTINAAYASFDEDKKGTIEAGKYADLTLISDDPRKIQPGKIKGITVEMTIVNGKIVYARGSTQKTRQ